MCVVIALCPLACYIVCETEEWITKNVVHSHFLKRVYF